MPDTLLCVLPPQPSEEDVALLVADGVRMFRDIGQRVSLYFNAGELFAQALPNDEDAHFSTCVIDDRFWLQHFGDVDPELPNSDLYAAVVTSLLRSGHVRHIRHALRYELEGLQLFADPEQDAQVPVHPFADSQIAARLEHVSPRSRTLRIGPLGFGPFWLGMPVEQFRRKARALDLQPHEDDDHVFIGTDNPFERIDFSDYRTGCVDEFMIRAPLLRRMLGVATLTPREFALHFMEAQGIPVLEPGWVTTDPDGSIAALGDRSVWLVVRRAYPAVTSNR